MHRLLQRQLRRVYGRDYMPDARMQSLLDMVDSYYHDADSEQRVLNNALSVSTVELNAVNERMRVQNAEMTHTLLNTLSDGVYATDLQGHLTFMNAAAEQVLGQSERGLIGQAVHQVLRFCRSDGGLLPQAEVPHLSAIVRHTQVSGECRLSAHNAATLIPVAYRASPVYQGGRLTGALVSFQDISASQYAEESLQKAYTRVSEALAEVEFQKQAMDEHAIVSVTDSQGRITYANERLMAVSQYGQDELIGRDHRILNSGYHPHGFFAAMWSHIRQGEVWQGQICNRRKDGALYWVESTIVPFLGEQGQVLRYVAIRTDITQSKQNEMHMLQNRERLDLAVEGSNLALWDWDIERDQVYLSERWNQMLGGKAEPLICISRDLFYTGKRQDMVNNRAALLAAMDGSAEQLSVEVRVKRYDGSCFWVHIHGKVVERDAAGNAMRMAGTNADITLRKKADMAILEARDAAEQATRSKSEFLANMSHEIRTPMNGIIGMTTLALDVVHEAEPREYLELVKTSADALLTIINDILDFSRIETGKFSLEAVVFSLLQLLNDTVRTLAVRAEQKGLKLVLKIAPDVPDRLSGDPGRLRQVLVNLIGNAIKFTHRGEVVLSVVTTAAAVPGRACLRLSVSDTGIGIPAKKFQRIFESFSQADTSTTRQYGGTGLGLTISAQLIEMMGGRIQLSSEEGVGTTFFFTLDLPVEKAGPVMPMLHAAANLEVMRNPLKLLLAEDNMVNQILEVSLLKKLGHSVAVASNGLEAVEQWQQGAFDAILMDVDMPQMNGYEASEYIRAQEGLSGGHIPILAMTAHVMQGVRDECLSHGMDGYLSKPIDINALRYELEQLGEPAG